MKRSFLNQTGKSDVAKTKVRLQKILRETVILRDEGCVLEEYPEANECGGYTQDGILILQAEHLITRANTISFADIRNIVCLCVYHHRTWKPQHSMLYWELIEEIIGEERWKWIKEVEADKKPHPMGLDGWIKLEMALTQELKQLKANS